MTSRVMNQYLLLMLARETKYYDEYSNRVLHFIPINKIGDYTMIAQCKCPNEAQDEIYGKGGRVFNKTSKEGTFRCTSCAHEIKTGITEKKKGKK